LILVADDRGLPGAADGIVAALRNPDAGAQVMQCRFPLTIDIAKVDVQKVAAGYRASNVIGSNVLNEADERQD
jgi:hypothetical protein